MSVFNVQVDVVELIEADTIEDAKAALIRALDHHGFSAGDGDAFESEPVPPEAIYRYRPCN